MRPPRRCCRRCPLPCRGVDRRVARRACPGIAGEGPLKQAWLNRLAQIGADPADDDNVRIQKSLLVVFAIPLVLVGLLWGVAYFLAGVWAGAIPFSYGLFSLLSTMHFARTRRYGFFCFSQLALILVLPFALMTALGGFVTGSGVILWSLISPLGSMLFDEPRRAPRWFGAFCALVVVSGLIQPSLHPSSELSSSAILFFFVFNFTGVGTIAFLMVLYFVGQRNLFQEKSEALLLNILPKEIARILRNESRTIADDYESASVLFADMVGFTPLTAELAPVEMVDLLNEAFSHFDSLLDRYGVEKIRTIGDSYMVASGVPGRRADHAQALVRMALEMRDFTSNHTFRNGRRLSFRIGVNSGSMIGGVIGTRKFVYDVWGDAVNVASRMESHGVPGAIQITRATYELIKDEFACEARGSVNVKGKGPMDVWLVHSAIDSPQTASRST